MSAAESLLELQLRAASIAFEREVRFHATRRWRFDFALPAHRLAVEVEGITFGVAGRHQRGAGVRADCEKYAEALCLGWRVLRVVPDQVKSGQALVWIERLLADAPAAAQAPQREP